MKFFIENKRILICGFMLLAVAALFFSFKCPKIGTVLSALGSIASLYAIIVTLARIKTLKDETYDIKEALNGKIETLNLKETTEQINKNIQIVARIQGFINSRNHDAAIILMEQLLSFLQLLNCNPTTEDTVVDDLKKYIKQLKIDIRNTRVEVGAGPNEMGLNYKLLTMHFTELEDFLTKVAQQNHFKNDQQ